MNRAIELTVWLGLLVAAPAVGQTRPQTPPPPPPGVTPQPVGRGRETSPPATTSPATAPQPAPRRPASQAPAIRAATPAAPAISRADAVSAAGQETAPTESQLGVPVFPGARFLRSFDAGRGQRYYLFGATASFAELVAYYRTALKERGDVMYEEPPIHIFEVGRFRDETMAFPPGVVVKDYTWGGAAGYLVPTPGASPDRYPTVIQIVPVTGAR